jgi:hypothetical protein
MQVNRKKIILAAVLATILSAGLLTSSQAQGGNGGNGGGGRRGGGRAGGFGGNGFGGVGGFGRAGAPTDPTTSDPTRSYLLGLLQRSDVRTELMITAQQREALDALQTSAGTDLQKTMTDLRNQQRQNRNAPPDPNAAPLDRNAQRQQMRDKMQAAFQTFQSDLDKKIAAILTPAQMKRLHELDLRWRGPLALSETLLADYLQLNTDQRTGIKAALDSYRTAQRDAIRAQFAGMPRNQRPGRQGNNAGAPNPGGNAAGQQPNPGGNAPGQPQTPLTPQEMQARADKAKQETAKARKEAEAKALAVLNPNQLQGWRTLIGRPFTFRAVD